MSVSLAVLACATSASAAPHSVYNGDAFTSAPTTAATDAQDGVALQSGGYSYSFPIAVPPGRLGLQPQISLGYRSDSAVYGGIAAGWSLDLPAIQLDTSDGLLTSERHWVSSLSGGERLVAVDEPGGPGVSKVYRARYDLAGTRYEHYSSAYPYEWVARMANGTVYRFGKRDVGGVPREIALLYVAEDAYGNRIDYDWTWSKVLLSELVAYAYTLDAIRYTSNPGANLAAFARVDFSYESQRACKGSQLPVGSQLSVRTGTPIVHGYGRLTTISTSTVDRPSNGGLVNVYHLLYVDEEESCDADAAPRRQLWGVKSTGYSPDGSWLDAPPVVFGYFPRTKRPEFRDTWTIGDREDGQLRTTSNVFVDHMLVDVDGDGLPDRLSSEEGDDCDFYWQRNTGFGFEDARRHVDRPRLPYGTTPDDWALDDTGGDAKLRQGCALNLQYTLVTGNGAPADLEQRCSHDGYNVRAGTLVNWRFLDADHDGLVDMVAGVDANELALDADDPGFDDHGLLDQVYERYSPGTLYGDLSKLLEASVDAYDGDTEWGCENQVPVEENKSFPWAVFRNLGGGHFAETPETWAMPVPVVASSSTARKAIGEGQVGPAYDEVTLPGGTAETLADPFSLVDIDGDGLVDVVSSYKTQAEIDGNAPPSNVWKVFRGRPDGLFDSLPQDQPFTFYAPIHAHANGIYVDGGLGGPGWHPDTFTSYRFGASASGMYELNGDGVPDFAWVESDSYDPDQFEDWNTSLHAWVSNGLQTFDYQSSESYALSITDGERIGDGGVSNLSARVMTSTIVWDDSDGDGEVDSSHDFGTASATPTELVDIDGDGRQDLVNRDEVRFNVGDAFLPPRPLPDAWRFAVRQQEFAERSDVPASYATTMLADVDGDGRMDPMIHQVRALDPDGNGMIDELDLPVFDEPGTWSVYLAPHEPPGLLRSIDNGMGGRTYIGYASVRDDWVVDDWNLPAQSWVVSTVTATGGTASPDVVTGYHYADPAWVQDDDGQFGFRGFRYIAVESPTGAWTESTFDYSLLFKGLLAETVVSDGFAPGLPPQTIETPTWEKAWLGPVPLIVAKQRDSRTCAAGETLSHCRTSGALLRTINEWKPITAWSDQPQMYVPWQVTTGDVVTTTEFVSKIDATTYRIKPTVVERRSGGQLLGRAETIYDATLRFVKESRSQVDETRVAITRFGYDGATGLVTSVEPPESVAAALGQVSTTTYDAQRASVLQVVNALGHVVTTKRDLGTGVVLETSGPQYKCGSPCTAFNKKWRKTLTKYDGLGRVSSVSRSFDDGPTQYKMLEVERETYYEWNGTQPAESTAITEMRIDLAEPALWTRSETVIDGLGRTMRDVRRTFEAQVPDAVTTYHYDARGLVVAVDSPDPSQFNGSTVTMKYAYDGLGRLTDAVHSSGLGGTRHAVYDGLDLETYLESSDGGPATRVRVSHDVLGRLVRIEERTSQGPPAVTEYAYDDNDNLIQVIDADGLVTTLDHDLAGHRRSVQRGGRTWSYQFDLEGRVVSSTVPHLPGQTAAHTSTLTYDALGRVKVRSPAPGTLTAAEQSEVGFGPVKYTYDEFSDALGAASRITTPVMVEEFRYDPTGNVVRATQKLTAAGGPTDLRTSTSTYDAMGNAVDTMHADGTHTFQSVDRRGLVRQVRTSQLNLARQVRNTAGAVTSRTFGYGSSQPPSVANWQYDALGRLRQEVVFARLGGWVLQEVARQDHDYFDSGDVRHVSERIFDSYRQFDFTYDQQSQIESARDDHGYAGTYKYTPAGRMLSTDLELPSGADVPSRNVFYDYDTQDLERVRALIDMQTGAQVVKLGYDEGGSIIAKSNAAGDTTYRYDADGRLRLVIRGTQREVLHYDAAGRRVLAVRKTGGTVTETRRDVGDVHIVQQGNTTSTELTVSLQTPVARIRNGSIVEYLNHNATGNLMVAVRSNGQLAAGFSYGAFGEVLQVQGGQSPLFRRRYQDRERDDLSTWYDYGSRLYDPETLIWNRVDPLYRFAPEAAGAEPRRMALYTFSLNNPLRYVDPDGRDPYEEQTDYTPPDVAGYQAGQAEWKANYAGQAAAAIATYGQLVMSFDITGISDIVKLGFALYSGDEAAIEEAGTAVAIDAIFTIGTFGLGKLIKGASKWAKAASKVDEVEEGLIAASKIAGAGDEVAGAGAKLSDIPEAFKRNGKRSLFTQPPGSPHCMVDACAMVLDTMGVTPDPVIMNKWRAAAESTNGLNVYHGARILEEHGLTATAHPVLGTDRLAQITARGTPVVAVQRLRSGPLGIHAVVVDGITTKPMLGRVAAVRNPWGIQYFQNYNRFWSQWLLEAITVSK